MDFHKLPRNRQDFYNEHKVPTTRRDFLSLGIVTCTAASFINPYTLAAKTLNHLHTDPSSFEDDPAFIVIDLAGGAGLSANFLVGNKGGAEDLLPSYKTLGWKPKEDGYDKRFGAPMAKENISGLLKGILSSSSEEAQGHFRMGTLLHNSADDTSSNPSSAASLVYNMGNTGKELKQIVGLERSISGGNSSLANPLNKSPYYLTDLDGLINSIGLKSIYGDDTAVAKKVFSLINRISKRQTNDFNPDVLSISTKSYSDSIGLATKSINVDPRLDKDARDVFGLNEDQGTKENAILQASIVLNSLNLNVGPGVITIGGCDYHDNTSATGDAKDEEIGVLIGRIIELASRKGKKVFLQIITDGGVDSVPGSRVWRGDSGERSMGAIGFFDPKRAITYKTANSSQIGFYNKTETADRSSLIGASPRLAAYAAYANYLNISGKIQDYEKYMPGIFSKEELESILIFEA
jgi:hypothetical protein